MTNITAGYGVLFR